MSEAGTAAHVHDHHDHHDDIVYPAAIPFILVHLACFAAIWSGVTLQAVIMCVAFYVLRMWAITAGFHRYFSHRSYKTSRVFQFVLAFIGQMSAQRGVLWWAALHRHHHQHSDTEHDVHSPHHTSLYFSHVGWIFAPSKNTADYDRIPDLTAYPELVWLDKHHYFPAAVLAVICFLIGGWPGLVVGFFWSTVLLYHGAFSINSLAHTTGKTRYVTGDHSRNNWFLALITLGEGWHNNHHAYQSSTRQGFFWWEIDISFYVLWMMSKVGLVWDLRSPPAALVHKTRRLGRKVVEKVARDLAASFPTDRISHQVRERLPRMPDLSGVAEAVQTARASVLASLPEMPAPADLRRVSWWEERAGEARRQVQNRLADLHLPELPSVEEIRATAIETFEDTPSLDEIVERARELILEAVSVRLLAEPHPA